MVRLKAEGTAGAATAVIEFQFLYGAIKRRYEYPLMMKFFIFQFLYGAIKSIIKVESEMYYLSFQFLYGAIKSNTHLSLYIFHL